MTVSKEIQELLHVPTPKTVDCILCVGGGIRVRVGVRVGVVGGTRVVAAVKCLDHA